ncbi:lactase-phlorizin hydrolase [Thraustotheca clavata]|uniref:Lactase-phlorizin hydrolase n=1 Tax=Thraustotheca clavata TaxID=74557 RepID=A0A1W0A568_9STRA|nr:lactase-phlorizin hydrolase [Thraustotheca clavata]
MEEVPRHVVVYGELSPEQKKNYSKFIVDHKIKFAKNADGLYIATVRLEKPPQPVEEITPPKIVTLKERLRNINVQTVPETLKRYSTLFSMLESGPTLQPSKAPLTLLNLIKTIHDIYDTRWIEPQTDGNAQNPFCSYIYHYFKTRYGLLPLVEQHIIDFLTSLQANSEHLDAEIFSCFLDGTYNEGALVFFLNSRSKLLKIMARDALGFKLNVVKDSVWISKAQCFVLAHQIFGSRAGIPYLSFIRKFKEYLTCQPLSRTINDTMEVFLQFKTIDIKIQGMAEYIPEEQDNPPLSPLDEKKRLFALLQRVRHRQEQMIANNDVADEEGWVPHQEHAILLWTSSLVLAENGAKCFPKSFLFGTATAAYQVEGGWNETGRTPSIWDEFCRDRDIECANVADDMIHRYESDVLLMKSMGLKSFRLSISWSRVMTWNPAIKRMVRNDAGIAFYHQLLDSVIAAEMQPIVTLYHWDLPAALHHEFGGWLSRKIIPHYKEYANLMFEEFGSKVPYWTTFNEPWSFCVGGYAEGFHAPGLSHSETNSYLAAHHVLLSHATVVRLFWSRRHEFYPSAKIGIVLNTDMTFPLDPNSPGDVAAAERRLQFFMGWFLSPVVYGDYPYVMKLYAKDHLPTFTADEKKLLAGTYDIFMLNHYSSSLITDCNSTRSLTKCDSLLEGWDRDLGIDLRAPVGSRSSSLNSKGQQNCPWFSGYPEGYLPLIRWLNKHNTSTPILLTENGWCGNEDIDNQDQLWYFQTYLDQVWQGLQEGLPIVGYTAWSFLDNYEWGSFDPRFGLFYVEFTNQTRGKDEYQPLASELKRIPRTAALWFGQVANSMCLDVGSTEFEAAKPVSSLIQAVIYFGYVGPLVIAIIIMRTFHSRRRPKNHETTPLLNKP